MRPIAFLRLALLCAIAGCGAAAAGYGAAPAGGAADAREAPHPWPMFRGRAHHRGVVAGARPPSWRVRWQVELGERIDASPLIDASGSVWVATRAGTIARLDGASGEVLARRTLRGGVWATPALAGDLVITAVDSGHIVALDRASLETRWRRRAPARSFSALTVRGSRVFVCSGRALLELSARDGHLERSLDLGAPSFTAPAVSDDGAVLVVATRSGEVIAVDAKRLAVRWRATTSVGADNDGSPTIADTTAFVGSNDGSLYAFDLATGTRRWRSSGEHWVVSTPAVAGGVVYYGDDGGNLRAVSARDGALRWRARVGDDLASSPTLVGSLVVHGAHDGKLWAHDSRTGAPHREPIALGSPAYASIAIAADGTIAIATHQGRVVAVE